MRIVFYLIISIIAYLIANVVYSKVKIEKHKAVNILFNIGTYILIWLLIYGLSFLLSYLLLWISLQLGGAPAQH